VSAEVLVGRNRINRPYPGVAAEALIGSTLGRSGDAQR
jgi:hypothetical protein